VLGLLVAGEEVYLHILSDPEDGCRSVLGGLVVRPKPENCVMAFKDAPIRVRVETAYENEGFRGYEFNAIADGYTWCRIGSDFSDDYYPFAVATVYPRPPQETHT
jgi:hypothetical protein